MWRKSSYNNGGTCVEVAEMGGRAVRDSKDRTGPVLQFTPVEWFAFTTSIRGGEF